MTIEFRIASLLLTKKIEDESWENSLLFLDPATFLANSFDANTWIRAGTTAVCQWRN